MIAYRIQLSVLQILIVFFFRINVFMYVWCLMYRLLPRYRFLYFFPNQWFCIKFARRWCRFKLNWLLSSIPKSRSVWIQIEAFYLIGSMSLVWLVLHYVFIRIYMIMRIEGSSDDDAAKCYWNEFEIDRKKQLEEKINK